MLSVGSKLCSSGRTLTERECTVQRLALQATIVCPLRSVWMAGCNHIPLWHRFFSCATGCRKSAKSQGARPHAAH
jgi:HD-like signal output (HDOD) protein